LDQQQRALRVGLAAVACALAFRLCAMGVPERIVTRLVQPDAAAFLTYLETGRDVRFSPSREVFSPDFVESPPPALPQVPLASFSGADSVEVYNTCGKDPDIAALLAQPLDWDLRQGGPAVLIVHTHSTESYTRAGEDYQESSPWRTLDESYNMLSIGALVGRILAENGITAIQDRQLHDYPSYNGSYVDARQSIQAYLREYPSIRLVLDLHRDAAEDGNGQMRTRAKVAGEDSAQLMLVMGTNYDTYPQNLSLALKLHTQLESQAEGIMRPLQLRGQRFNQDLCPGALLVEVGAAGNTHREAVVAAEALAQAIVALAEGTP